MPLDIMSGFSGGAAPTGAARTGAPPVLGSEPSVTFASLLTGKATASPQGAVNKKSGHGDAKKDDGKSDPKTGDASVTLDSSQVAQNIVPPTLPPQLALPQSKSVPNGPSNADTKAGTSVAMDASQVLSRPQASGSQTGGELLSTLKQTMSAASAGLTEVRADVATRTPGDGRVLMSGAAAPASSTVTTGGAATPVISSSPRFGAPVHEAKALSQSRMSAISTQGNLGATETFAALGAGTVAADLVDIDLPAGSAASSTLGAGASIANGASSLSRTIPHDIAGPTDLLHVLVPSPNGVGADAKVLAGMNGASAPTTSTANPLTLTSMAAASMTSVAAFAGSTSAGSMHTLIASGAAPKTALKSINSTLQKVRGGADNNGVNDARITGKGAAKEGAASLLQSMYAKGANSGTMGSSTLSEALVKAEFTGKDVRTGVVAPTALSTLEPGKTTTSVVDQPVIAAMPARDRAAMIHQVVEKIGDMRLDAKGAGGDKVTLQLHPQDWGQLNLTVTMTPKVDAKGQMTTLVTAHVAAENPSVKAALEGHMNELRLSLHEHGLKLGNLTVTVDTVSAASSQTSGGESMFGSRHSEESAQAQTSQSSAQSGGFNGSRHEPSSFADFAAGQFGGGRRESGEQLASWTAHDAEVESTPVSVTRSHGAGRVDTRA